MLRDMFPTLDTKYLAKILQDCEWDTTAAAEKLLDESHVPPSGVLATSSACRGEPSTAGLGVSSNVASSSGTSSQGGTLTPSLFDFKSDISAQELLAQVSQRVLKQGRYIDLIVPRDRIWRVSLGFYKQSMNDPEQLRREL